MFGILISLLLIMIAAMEIKDFIAEKMDSAKCVAERKAVFNSFYEVDKTLKYLK